MLDPLLLPNPYFRLGMVPDIAQMLSVSDIIEAVSSSVSTPEHHNQVIEEFAEEFARFVGARFAFPMSSGRCALYVILRALGIGKGSEVIIPSFVCGMVADAVALAGARPVLVDVNPHTGLIDCQSVRASITDRTRAVIPVHYQGLPCEMGELKDLANENHIRLIEDCAHALGSRYHAETVGTIGDAAFFSFGSDKPMTTGLGGMIITSSREAATAVEHTITQADLIKEVSTRKVVKAVVESLILHDKRAHGLVTMVIQPLLAVIYGAKPPLQRRYGRFETGRITRLAAALGLKQLVKVAVAIKARSANASLLEEGLKNNILAPTYDKEIEPVFLRYTVLAKNAHQRRVLVIKLKHKGVGAGPINWKFPLHKSEYYSEICKAYDRLSGAEEFASRFINLPCHEMLTPMDIDKICSCFKT